MTSSVTTLNKAYTFLMDQESQRNLVHSAPPSVGLSSIEGSTMYSHKGPAYHTGSSSSSFMSGRNYSGGASTSGIYKTRQKHSALYSLWLQMTLQRAMLQNCGISS